MSNTKKYTFNEVEALQLGQALKGALRNQSPLKLTIARCAKELEGVLAQYRDEKQVLMEAIVVKGEDGKLMPLEGLEKEPVTILDYQLNIPKEEAIEKFEAISEKEVEVELPVISDKSKVIVDGEKLSLEEYLDMCEDASGHLAYIYLKLTE